MKKNQIYFIFLFLSVFKVNGQEKKDTIIRQLNGCEYTIIMKKGKYTVDTLYAEIEQKVKVQFGFNRYFSTNSIIVLRDTTATLVDIVPSFYTIRYLNTNKKRIDIVSMKHIKKKYQKIIQPVIKAAYVKTKGEILHTTDNPHCLNIEFDMLEFYVFPLKITTNSTQQIPP